MALVDDFNRSDPFNGTTHLEDDGLSGYLSGYGVWPSTPPGVTSGYDGSYDGVTITYYYTNQVNASVSGFAYGYIQQPADESNGTNGQNRPLITPVDYLARGFNGPFTGPNVFHHWAYGQLSQVARIDQNYADGGVAITVGVMATDLATDHTFIRLWGRINNIQSSTLTAYMFEARSNGVNYTMKLYKVTNHNTFVQVGSTFTGAIALNDRFELRIIGSTLTVKQNATTRISTTDATYGSAGLWGFGCGGDTGNIGRPIWSGGFGLLNLELELTYLEVATINPITTFGGWEADFYSRTSFSGVELHTTFDAATIGSVTTFDDPIDHYCHPLPNLTYFAQERFQFYDDLKTTNYSLWDAQNRFSCFLNPNPEANPC